MSQGKRKRFFLGTLPVLAAFLALGNADAQPMTDQDIALAVDTELQHSEVVRFYHVGISVDDGIVTFTGNVPSVTAFRQIEDIASTVRGVRGIVNRLEIDAEPQSAAHLREQIQKAMDANPATDLYQLDIEATDDGVVTLTGSVDSWAERDLAESVAGRVMGVKAVENLITVDAASFLRGIGDIKADITERLRWDARVDDSLISVLVRQGGHVTLSGTVGSLAEKRLAARLARVQGVRSVDTMHLEVEPWARDEDRRLGVDGNILDVDARHAVEKALVLDPRVASRDIEVSVIDGEAWLRGTVGSVSAWRSAAQTASNTTGIERVQNLLTIDVNPIDDDEIAHRATEALETNDMLLNDDLSITVTNGHAALMGDVANGEEYWQADEIAANTRGIESLTNLLTIAGKVPHVAIDPYMDMPRVITPGPGEQEDVPSDRSLYSAIESEFFWSPFVDEDEVDINVEDGTVTLTGNVDSRSEFVAAAENAFQAGAVTVKNQLDIK